MKREREKDKGNEIEGWQEHCPVNNRDGIDAFNCFSVADQQTLLCDIVGQCGIR